MNTNRTLHRTYAVGLAALGLATSAMALAPSADALPTPYRHKPVSVERARTAPAVQSPSRARTVQAAKRHGRKRCYHPFRAVRVKCSGGRYELHPYGRD